MPNRRAWLSLAAVAVLGPAAAWARARARPLRLAAAWDDALGRHQVGVLEVDTDAPGGLAVRHRLEVPTRAHAVTPLADGDLVAVARRPGAWMLRWRPGQPATQAVWRWSEPDRSFNGHVIAADAGRLLSTETDAADGAGLLVQRDVRTLAVQGEWPTGGIDPHALLAGPDGGWLVANGGVPTRPEGGRVKLDRAQMDSSLVRLDRDGRIVGQWRLADRRLSLRHLARQADGLVGIALQAEHDDPAQRAQAPLLALWDGERLAVGEAAPLSGYAGDIVATPDGFAVGATRAGCVVRYDHRGRIVAQQALAEACALAALGGGWLAAGRETLLRGTGATDAKVLAARPGLRIDNHWVPVSA